MKRGKEQEGESSLQNTPEVDSVDLEGLIPQIRAIPLTGKFLNLYVQHTTVSTQEALDEMGIKKDFNDDKWDCLPNALLNDKSSVFLDCLWKGIKEVNFPDNFLSTRANRRRT